MTPSSFERRRPWALVAFVFSLFAASVFAACSGSNGGPAPSATSPDAARPDGASDASTPDATREAAPPFSDAGTETDANGDGGSGDAEAGCAADGAVPNDLSCTGLYADWATKTIATSAQPYTPAFILWSDGATKDRWIYLPPGSQIDTTDMDDWVFPDGTKIWKQFSVGGTRVETRLLWKAASQWNVLDYRWSSDGQTSATLLTTGATNVNGTTYEIPSTTECFTCHAGRNDMILGFDVVGVGAPGAQGVTLADLVMKGLLTQAPPATTIVIPEDTTGKAAAALGYLHINCGASCHNSNFAADAYETHLYAKLLMGELYPDAGAGQVTALDTYTTTVNIPGTLTPNGVQYLRIAPGDAGQSLLPLMALTRETDGGFLPMPPIVSHVADTTGMAQVQGSINAL